MTKPPQFAQDLQESPESRKPLSLTLLGQWFSTLPCGINRLIVCLAFLQNENMMEMGNSKTCPVGS